MKKNLILALFTARTLFASQIPQYQIASLDGNVVTLANNSSSKKAKRSAATKVWGCCGEK